MSVTPERSLHCYKAAVSSQDVQRIVQSCVFLTEQVLLPAAIVPQPHLPAAEQAAIMRRLHELKDIGAVRFWEIEGQSRYLLSTRGSTAAPNSFAPDVVMPVDAYRNVYAMIVDRLVNNRQRFLGVAIAGSLDGVAEFVLGKHALWTMALREYLKTRHVVFDPPAARNTARFFVDLLSKQEVAEGVVSRLMHKLSIPDVSMLDISQIERCRRFLPAFRDDVMRRIPEQPEAAAFREGELAEQIAEEVMNEFFDVVQRSLATKGVIRTLAWRLGQLVLSPLITREYADRFFGWFGAPPLDEPLLLLFEIHRQLKDGSMIINNSEA